MARPPAVVCVLALGTLAFVSGFARAGTFPETVALQGELVAYQGSLDNLNKRLDRANAQVEAARKQVQLASAICRSIAQTDDGMARVIKELKTLSAIPQLKMLPPAVKLLEGVKKLVHGVRVKTDKCEDDVLKPLAKRLDEVQIGIRIAIVDVKASSAKSRLAHAGFGASRSAIEKRGNKAGEVATLEQAAKAMRAAVEPAAAGIAALDRTVADLESRAAALVAGLKAVTALKPGVDKIAKDLKPFNDAAAELKQVMGQKVGIKLFEVNYSFTVRQVLEGPRNVSDLVLKPLQDLADKAIAEVMKAFKLKLEAPAEIRAMAAKVAGATTAATNFAGAFTFDTGFLKTFDAALAKMPKS